MPSCVVVVEDGKPIGIFTERDLIRLAATENTIANRTVETVMTDPLIIVNQAKSNDLFAVLDILQQHHIRHLPIVDDDGKLVGISTHESICQSLQPSDLLRLRYAAETMTRDVIQAAPTATLQSIAQLMAQHQISCVVITETIENKTFPLGIVTEGDIVQFQALLLNFAHLTAQSVMSRPVFCVSPELSLWQAHQLMGERQITHLVITHEDGSLAGILTQTTILNSLNPAEMVEVISLLQQQVERLETEKLQLLESRNIELQQAMNREVDTHQQTEFRLRESEKDYASLVAMVPVVIFRADNFGACTYINKYWTELTGIPYQETLGQGWVQGIYYDDQDQVVSSWRQMVQIGHSWQQEFRLQLPDGSIKWVYGQAQPEWEDTGKVSSYVGSLTDIRNRKQAKAQLKITTQRLQQAQRIAKLGHWDINLQTSNLYWSDEVFSIFEIDPKQFGASYEAFLDAIHPDDREIVNQAYSQHVQDGLPYSIIHRLLMPDGRIKYVQEQCETIHDDDGKAILSHGTVLDITNLKEEEYKRQQAETSLRRIVEGTAAVIEHDFFQELVQHITTALDVRYASISEATSDGFAVLAFCADGHLQTVNHCPYEQFPCCTQALQQGQCYHADSLLQLYPDNELFSTLNAESYLGIGLRNSVGKPIGNLCLMHDRSLNNPEWMISLLKIFGARASAELERYQTACQLQALTNDLEQRVEERTAILAKTVEHLKTEVKRRQALTNLLLKSQAQLQDIFDSANDMIQSVSLVDGSFEFVNRSWLETLGYTIQDLEQIAIFDVLHPAYQEHCIKLMKQMKMGQLQSLDQIEISFVAKNGRVIDVEGNINCRIVDGQPIYTLGIFRDISDRKKAETKIIEALERERELNEMKTRFVSNTSHEFRTPLTVISSNAELLKLFGDKLDETEKRKCLDTILDYVDHAAELIDEVLIVSKAESGKIQLKPKLLDVIEFSQQLNQTISLSAPNHHLEFVIKDTRSQSQKHIHSAQLDSKILQQSLTNLLTNAIKYSPEGGNVTFQLELLPNTIQFRVIDAGIGIPEVDQKYLFEPFHRANNVGTIQGTGLGLSIVKRLITIHQGNIDVKSAPGKGSCFTITIPIQW
jgi:PAS domain S-box-containing protein